MIETSITTIYSLAVRLAAPAAAWWMRRRRRWSDESVAQRYGRSLPASSHARPIWIHAASMGEVRVGATLGHALSPQGAHILASAMTETGYELIRSVYPAGTIPIRAPFDLRVAVTRACEHFAPSALVLVETEWWPNLIRSVHERGIPIFVVNGRVSSQSYLTYKFYWRRILSRVEHFYMRSDEDAEHVREIGVEPARIEVAGSMKNAAILPSSEATRRRVIELSSNSQRIWIAGSTRQGEDELILAAHQTLLQSTPDLQLWLAPRHPERFEDIAALVKQHGLSVRRWSESNDNQSSAKVVLVDQMGVLPELYGFTDVAFVGGSLRPFGGHNPMEPALAGTPVLFGPHMESQRESAEILMREGLAEEVRDPEGIARAVAQKLSCGSETESREDRIKRLRRRLPDVVNNIAVDLLRRLGNPGALS